MKTYKDDFLAEEKLSIDSTLKIEQLLCEAFTERKLTLSIAESCTGGAISAKLAAVSGASAYFKGAIIAYSNFIKSKLLSVENVMLEKQGAVSEYTAIGMAKGAILSMQSDFSLSITGFAGPAGGSEHTPVGTIWISVATHFGDIWSWHLLLEGKRSEIIEKAANAALFRLWQRVNGV